MLILGVATALLVARQRYEPITCSADYCIVYDHLEHRIRWASGAGGLFDTRSEARQARDDAAEEGSSAPERPASNQESASSGPRAIPLTAEEAAEARRRWRERF